LFSEAAQAIATSPRLVASTIFPGRYDGVIAQYRDANEGNEEFSSREGAFRLSRVGGVDITCEPHVELTPSRGSVVPGASRGG
jgi:hypothetical protein